jgi:hypothetical protein
MGDRDWKDCGSRLAPAKSETLSPKTGGSMAQVLNYMPKKYKTLS